MTVIVKKQYPNVIVLHHDDADGVCAAAIIKKKYDNKIVDQTWESNVLCIPCRYTKKHNLKFFKDAVLAGLKQDQKNIVFMVDYCIWPTQDMVKFYSWLKSQGIQLQWIDHHEDAIEELSYLDIPGKQSVSKAACQLTSQLVFPNKVTTRGVKLLSMRDLGTSFGEDLWKTQIKPLGLFVDSLGSNLNDVTSDVVRAMCHIADSEEELDKFIDAGKLIAKYVDAQEAKSGSRLYQTTHGQLRVLAVNSPIHSIQQFESHQKLEEFDLLVAWSYNGQHYQNWITTKKSGVNVGQICREEFGGHGDLAVGVALTDQQVF